jgi:hypothetical protein
MDEITPVCANPTKKHPNGRTGTRAGYLAHYYAGESSCDVCLEGNARQVAADRIADPEHVLRGNLATRFNLSVERYREILDAQDGKCAICGTDSPTDIRTDRFHVDHDHACCPGRKSCGKCVRGLLCHACNTALGNFKDSPDRLLSALAYLASHGKGAAS